MLIRPQPGPQTQFLSSTADIVIYGGAFGAGKTYALTLEPMRHASVPGFGAIVFRRISSELTGSGSIWQEACGLYPLIGGSPREGEYMDWKFPSGATVEFSHLQQSKHVISHLSKQYALIIMDQIEQFEGHMFWDLLGRNRSTCGVSPYFRAGCNPDPDCFLYENGKGLIAWWIGEDGYPIPERSGVIRYFVRGVDDEIVWGDSPDELREKMPDIFAIEPNAAKSITFIPGRLEDNQELMRKDPKYRANLLLLPKVKRERGYLGNWKIKATAGTMFRREWYEIVDAPPRDAIVRTRAWDLAASEPTAENPNPASTAGVRMSRDANGVFYIEHAVKFQKGPGGVERTVVEVANIDGERDHGTIQAFWQDPGGAGKHQAARITTLLAAWETHAEVAREDKVAYAEPMSAQCEQGNVKIVRGAWNDDYINEHVQFPDGSKKDQVDATSLGRIVCTDDSITSLIMLTKR